MNFKTYATQLAFSLLLIASCFPVYATKPCPRSPCLDDAGRLDRQSCEAKAEWVAQGSITHVQHHREGAPTNKDFAEFTFTVRQWEKTRNDAPTVVRFKVGWCDNQQELPSSTAGLFRVFGAPPGSSTSSEPRYLYIEPIRDKSTR